jgi:cation/acetate symporter
VLISKVLLLVVAVLAALVAARKPADILFLVSAAFSLAAAGFFPALVLGIFWKRTTGLAASLGMIAGFATTLYYMASTQVWLREIVFGVPRSVPVDGLWWEIQPIAAGVFGVPVGFAVIVLLSLVTPPPSRETQRLVENLRYPNLKAA